MVGGSGRSGVVTVELQRLAVAWSLCGAAMCGCCSQVYTTFKEKGIFVVVMQKDPVGLDPDSTWEAASNMKKYDDIYELSLSYTDGKTKAKRETTVKKSVGDFIDENGVICQDIIEPLVLKLHQSLASGKKDK